MEKKQLSLLVFCIIFQLLSLMNRDCFEPNFRVPVFQFPLTCKNLISFTRLMKNLALCTYFLKELECVKYFFSIHELFLIHRLLKCSSSACLCCNVIGSLNLVIQVRTEKKSNLSKVVEQRASSTDHIHLFHYIQKKTF